MVSAPNGQFLAQIPQLIQPEEQTVVTRLALFRIPAGNIIVNIKIQYGYGLLGASLHTGAAARAFHQVDLCNPLAVHFNCTKLACLCTGSQAHAGIPAIFKPAAYRQRGAAVPVHPDIQIYFYSLLFQDT